MPAVNLLNDPPIRHEYKANPALQVQAGLSPPKSTPGPTLGVIINDSSFNGSNISGNAVVENFSGFDFKSAQVINTAAFKGARITGGKVSNFSGTR